MDAIIHIWKSDLRGTPFSGCWLWQGWVDKDGYGQTSWEGKNVRVHIATYESVNGPVPEGLNVCHACDTPPCYRPDHLFAGSQKDNIQDMISKGRFVGNRGNTKLPAVIRQRILSWDPKLDGSLMDFAASLGVTRQSVYDLRRSR